MALLASEISRIKAELGYSVHTAGAIPYRTVWNTFDLVLQDYVQAGATTFSSTDVTSTGAVQQVILTLVSSTGFSDGAAVVVDVDSRQERATIQCVSGSAITVLLSNTHTGTYPVTVEGGESIVRDKLRELVGIGTQLTTAQSSANLARVDEVWFHKPGATTSTIKQLRSEQMRLRDELAAILNVPNYFRVKGGGGSALALF